MTASLEHRNQVIESGRAATLAWTAKQVAIVDGEEVERAIAFDAGDDVLWKLAATRGGTPVIDLSTTANDNGSLVVVDELGDTSDVDPDNWVAASGRVVLKGDDTALAVVTKDTVFYDELLLQDSADGDELKTICRGRVIVRPSQS